MTIATHFWFIILTIVETKDLNENTLLELDENGNIVSMTIEHAKQQTEVSSFYFKQVTKMAI